jgi:Cft2 family RNA processing exonuclease
MFLFQIEGKDILYSGDFRFSLKNIENIKLMKEMRNYENLTLYLDSTFLNEKYMNFPQQSESCDKIIEMIEDHLRKSSSNKGN